MPLSFEPQLDILPKSQRDLWPELDAVPSNFVLYGGTALVLQLEFPKILISSLPKVSIRIGCSLSCRSFGIWTQQLVRACGCITSGTTLRVISSIRPAR